jgi:hypothetical protein
MNSLHLITALSAALLLSSNLCPAETVKLRGDLNGSSEVRPNDSAGTGQVQATLDTDAKEFKYKVDYAGLSGTASAAHFHGPADAGKNAKPTVPIDKKSLNRAIQGQTKLTDEQMKEVLANDWYFNVHTMAHPDGEIRAQLETMK